MQTCASQTLFSWRAAAVIVLGATLALWPLLLHGGHPFLFPDTGLYVANGAEIWGRVAEAVSRLLPVAPAMEAGGAATASAAEPAASGAGTSIRSLPYSAAVGLVAPLGLAAVVWVQAAIVMVFVYAVAAALREALAWPVWAWVAGVMLTLSALPLIASLAMPDVLGAVVILFALLLVRGLDSFTTGSKVLLCALAVFAVLSHYGNIPLAVVTIGAALFARAALGARLRQVALVAGAACALGIGSNVILSLAAFDTASITPNRFPILLARSIEDGPARWYLEEACPEADYAVCTHWGDDIPDNVGDALWGPRGIGYPPAALRDRIREEEIGILWSAFRAYPLAQTASLTGNAVAQFGMVGADYAVSMVPAPEGAGGFVPVPSPPVFEALRNPLGTVQTATYGLAVLVLVWIMVFARPVPAHRAIAAVTLVGLVTNAAIFGGLSAPVDRYQARVAWVALLIAAFLLAERHAARRSDQARGLTNTSPAPMR